MYKMQLANNCWKARSRVVLKSVMIKCKGFHSSVISYNNPAFSSSSYVPVADFYNGKSVLVTGATGFLGMVLVEKLLYACTGIEKVFLLVREKKGIPPEQRLKQFLNDPLFQRLKDEKPTFLSKLVTVNGDIGLPGLGMKNEDIKTLSDEVSVVFHSAASVRFNDKLSIPLNLNFRGTERMLNLSKKMKKLEVFVHMSTAYAYTTKEKATFKEVLYPPPATLGEVNEFIAQYDNDEEMTVKFLRGRANTYTFCKALTENYIYENKAHVPVAIVRPSAVIAAAEGPLPGWLNDWQGVTRTVHNVANGHSRVNPGCGDVIIDFIPVDYVANLSIIVAAKSSGDKSLPIYNCSSSSVNPVTWRQAFDMFIEDVTKEGKNDLPCPGSIFTESDVMMRILTVLLQVFPAYVADIWLRIKGKEPKYVQIQKRVLSVRDSMYFFIKYSWVTDNSNSMSLVNSLSEQDRKLFPCNPAGINWRKYMHTYYKGVDKFLLRRRNKK